MTITDICIFLDGYDIIAVVDVSLLPYSDVVEVVWLRRIRIPNVCVIVKITHKIAMKQIRNVTTDDRRIG